MNIYQRIWDADQSGNGIKPILASETGDEAKGFVKVANARRLDDPDLRGLPEVKIPAAKMKTYDRVRALFDNYALDEASPSFWRADLRRDQL